MVQSKSISLGGSDWGSSGSRCSESESLCIPAFLARRDNKQHPGVVSHDYHDLKDAPVLTPEAGGSGKPQLVRHRGAVKQFPSKLYDILSKAHEEGNESIISWQPHGRCFIVRKSEAFTKEIMPRFFKGHSKLASFQRQLSLYGFLRLTCGRDKGAYYHERFLRGRPDLVHQLVRTRVKGTGRKLATSPASEPDFYGMPFCGVDGIVEANKGKARVARSKMLVSLAPAAYSSLTEPTNSADAGVAVLPELSCNLSHGSVHKDTAKPLPPVYSGGLSIQATSCQRILMPVHLPPVGKADKTPPVGPLRAPSRLCNVLKEMPQLASPGSTTTPATIYSMVNLPRDSSVYEMTAGVNDFCTGTALGNTRSAEHPAAGSNGSINNFSSLAEITIEPESLATEPLFLLNGIPPSPTGVGFLSPSDAMFWKQEQHTARQSIPFLPEEDNMNLDEFVTMWDT